MIKYTNCLELITINEIPKFFVETTDKKQVSLNDHGYPRKFLQFYVSFMT